MHPSALGVPFIHLFSFVGQFLLSGLKVLCCGMFWVSRVQTVGHRHLKPVDLLVFLPGSSVRVGKGQEWVCIFWLAECACALSVVICHPWNYHHMQSPPSSNLQPPHPPLLPSCPLLLSPAVWWDQLGETSLQQKARIPSQYHKSCQQLFHCC